MWVWMYHITMTTHSESHSKKQTVTSPFFFYSPALTVIKRQLVLTNEKIKVSITLNLIWVNKMKIWSEVNNNTVSQRLFVCDCQFYNPLCNPSCRPNLWAWQRSSGEACGAVSQTECDSSGSAVHGSMVSASVDRHHSWGESRQWKTTFNVWERNKAW